MTALPRSTDDLNGLRAARWIRESRRGQLDNYGPDAQRARQDRAVERFGLTDTGIVWQVAHSGSKTDKEGLATLMRTSEWQDMLARAGKDYDVLLLGYTSRLAREPETAHRVIRELHTAGAVLLFCDESLLSSNGDHWEWIGQAILADAAYSRRLSKRIREGIEAKHQRAYGDQHGTTPVGFKRRQEKPKVLEIDEAAIALPVSLFEKYATGQYTFVTLGAEVGMDPDRVREILAAPIFNGYFRRGKRSREESRVPAPWRDNPPVSDELWERVQEVRAAKAHGGGPFRPDRLDPLGRLIYCECGRYLKANGTDGGGHPQRVHPDPCAANPRGTYRSATWLEPLAAQIAQIDLSDATIAAVVAMLGEPPRRDELAERRLERERRAAADAFSTRRMNIDEFTAVVGALDERMTSLKSAPAPRQDTVAPERAVAFLKDLPSAWEAADDTARAGLLAAVYQQIVVRGPEFVAVHLTPEAMAHGLALALPERVFVARPAGIEPAT